VRFRPCVVDAPEDDTPCSHRRCSVLHVSSMRSVVVLVLVFRTAVTPASTFDSPYLLETKWQGGSFTLQKGSIGAQYHQFSPSIVAVNVSLLDFFTGKNTTVTVR
jgi:hypothetical protein